MDGEGRGVDRRKAAGNLADQREGVTRDFILEFEDQIDGSGNSGVAVHRPMKGDPPFDGMEMQVADQRYNPEAKDSELTGGIYGRSRRGSRSTSRRSGIPAGSS